MEGSTLKLYELHHGDCFTLDEEPTIPPNHIPVGRNMNIVYTLHHIDGMYSYVTDVDKNVYHFAAWTEVNPVNNT